MPQPQSRKRTPKPGPSPQGNGPSLLAVAFIRRPFGIRGELLLDLLVSQPRQLMEAPFVCLGGEDRRLAVGSLRRHGTEYVIRLEGVDDRNAAEALRGQTLFLRTDEQPPLPAGVYFLHQIEGLRVVTEEGEELGRVTEIIKTGANDVYVVSGERGEILLPAIPPVIREIRLEEGKMVVHLLDGLR
jgi:16S rRNA processing protein RimM